MKSERLAGSNLAEAAQLTSIVVRAGHVISADRANQLAAPGREPLRANRAIPGSILVRRGRTLFRIPCLRRLRSLTSGRLQRDRCTRLRLDPASIRVNRSCPFFRGTFHGPKVIAQPNAREKRVGRVGGPESRLRWVHVKLPLRSSRLALSVCSGLDQKPFSTHAFELPPASQKAMWRPSAEGMAQPISLSGS